jgi:flagellar assembly factor FliW
MRIDTTRFGLLDLEEAVFINFPWGIPGFEKLKRFVLLEHRQGPFQWLQAVDDPAVAFVVCAPEALGISYHVPEERANTIELENLEDLLVLIMISYDRDQGAIRPHFRGPLLFNVPSRLACQWTIDTAELDKYTRKSA